MAFFVQTERQETYSGRGFNFYRACKPTSYSIFNYLSFNLYEPTSYTTQMHVKLHPVGRPATCHCHLFPSLYARSMVGHEHQGSLFGCLKGRVNQNQGRVFCHNRSWVFAWSRVFAWQWREPRRGTTYKPSRILVTLPLMRLGYCWFGLVEDDAG